MTQVPGRRGIVVVLYLLGVLLFFEGASRAVLSVDTLFARIATPDDDIWWRRQWRQKRSRTIPIYYSFDDPHPTRGWAVKPNLRNLPVFEGKALSSNSRGARGEREYAEPKLDGVMRILVFGDSVTFGDEVSDDETYVAHLQAMLPGTEVLNLGVHGYGHDQMLLYLQEVGARYAPDVILLGFTTIDMPRNLLGFRDFMKPRFDVVGDHLVLRNTPVPVPRVVRARDPYRSRFVDLGTLLYARLRSPPDKRAERMDAVTGAILDEFRRTALGLAAVPVLVFLPIEDEITLSETRSSPGERFFFRYCRDRGIQAIDLRPVFRTWLRLGVALRDVGHWDPLEHRIAAEGIRDALIGRGVLPARLGRPSRGRPDGPLGTPRVQGAAQHPSTRADQIQPIPCRQRLNFPDEHAVVFAPMPRQPPSRDVNASDWDLPMDGESRYTGRSVRPLRAQLWANQPPG
jgi:lysophospholipase L1-like esterase